MKVLSTSLATEYRLLEKFQSKVCKHKSQAPLGFWCHEEYMLAKLKWGSLEDISYGPKVLNLLL